MAFFTSPEQEIYEHRLKRSSSTTSMRTRLPRSTGTPKPLPRSLIDSPLLSLSPASTLDDLSSGQHKSSVVPPSISRSSSPSPSRMTALHGREQKIQYSGLSSELTQAPVPSHTTKNSDDASRTVGGRSHSRDPEFGPPRLHLSTLSPSAFASHADTNLDTGSISDSGFASRPPRTHRRPDVPSAFNSRLSPLQVQHTSSSSPNLSLAGYRSDGGSPDPSSSPLHPSRLDVKRLLSKPAVPSVASTLSIASDSESHARTQPNSNGVWPSKTRIQAHAKPISGPSVMSSSGSPEQSPVSTPPSTQQRPRNLLRKKSTSGQARAAMSATLPRKSSISSPFSSTTRSPTAVSMHGQRDTTLQSVFGSQLAAPASAPPFGSGKLTPAGAIVQAYKEQDIRREALATAARAEKLSPVIPVGPSWPDAPGHYSFEQHTSPAVEEAAPYYTVFGGIPGRVVAVDSVQDAYAGDLGPYEIGSGSHSSQSIKTLTRKVSARFRRGLAAVSGVGTQSGHGNRDGEGEQGNTLRGDIKGDNPPPRHERQRSFSLPKAKRKPESLRLSLDQSDTPFSTDRPEDRLDEHLNYPMPSQSAADSVSPLAQSKGKEKAQEKDGGGRLWRLVKRISAGGLRERFQAVGSPPPPVPVLPKDLLPPRTTLEVQVPVTPDSSSRHGGSEARYGSDGGSKGMTSYLINSRLPMSAMWLNSDDRPFTATGSPSGIHTVLHGPAATSQPRRPSISSSPQSSEPTSTHFFRSHSSRSSFSSILCTSSPPPLPVPPLVQSSSPHTRSRTKSTSSSSARRPSQDEPQSSISPYLQTRKRSSPDIPAFSVSDVVNKFIERRPSLARHQQQQQQQQQRHHTSDRLALKIVTPSSEDIVSPPPRPTRNELRDGAHQRERDQSLLAPGSSMQSQDSHSSGSTERPPSRSTPTADTNTGPVALLTFRELGGARKQGWTSQEKEDKWDDLLEKSAQAGGTLHLGAGGARLASDNIRFSSSTISLSGSSSG
ncbi:hypothetical protein B0F90DRAFT_958501 [Multifurca ochricompacta]|uniref:Uncharacterized protein n=1 Tax=Multifurca ochricompacta TaxID=376703 RepID=A0AAD4QRF9_9AGAM|nr:hypothetical protein B0F90DRAFT_958501 [Multifurca ochricompacta]